jgi:hypothetical protein
MAFDYDKFRTPYYEIEVSDPSNKRKVKLPHHILRLVTKIEINEAYVSPENQFGATTATISFVEGSREPASQDPSMGTSGLYQMSLDGENTDMDIAGSITNRVGSIVDLRFSGSSGITFITDTEKKTGKVEDQFQPNVDKKLTTRKHKKETQAPKFLFDAYNLVHITWGYREDPTTIRKIVLSIINVETMFSDSGPTTINVLCSDKGALLNQIVPKSAKAFGEVLSYKGNAIIDFKDLKTDALIQKIAKDSGMATIVSQNILSDTLDKNHQKMWIAGESFHEFLTKLAVTQNCYYKIINNPKTAKPTIYFIKRDDFEAKPPIAKDKYFLLEYKQPGCLIRSVTVNADFVSPTGSASRATDDEGDVVGDERQVAIQQYKSKEGQVIVDPTQDPAVAGVADGILGGNYTGSVKLTPNQNPEFHSGQAKTQADTASRLVQIDLMTLGYTRFTPGVFNIGNIGVRYSGKYRILNVVHTIDGSGYSCRMSGSTHSLTSGGTKIPDAVPGQDEERTVEVQQFDGKVRDKLDADQGVK